MCVFFLGFIFFMSVFMSLMYMIITSDIYNNYCMTGRAIRGNILFEIDRIGPTEGGRDDTEVENGIFPPIARL